MKRLLLMLLCLSMLLTACAVTKPTAQDVFYYPSSEAKQIDSFFYPESRELPKDMELYELLQLYCDGPVTPVWNTPSPLMPRSSAVPWRTAF